MKTASLAFLAAAALALLGFSLWSNSHRASSSGALESPRSGVVQAASEPQEEVASALVPPREVIAAPVRVEEPEPNPESQEVVLSDEQRWLAKYNTMETKDLFQLARDLRREYFAFNAEEVERYVASGMATRTPLDQLTARVAPDPDTIPVMTIDHVGDGYLLELERKESPKLFAMRDESDWLTRFALGTDPTGNKVQDPIGIRRRESHSK